jgi:hypothetical protein
MESIYGYSNEKCTLYPQVKAKAKLVVSERIPDYIITIWLCICFSRFVIGESDVSQVELVSVSYTTGQYSEASSTSTSLEMGIAKTTCPLLLSDTLWCV